VGAVGGRRLGVKVEVTVELGNKIPEAFLLELFFDRSELNDEGSIIFDFELLILIM
jgi:hypothetical protein